jgi:hypothetical protein
MATAISALALVMLSAAVAGAQDTGSITGTVKDQSGGVLPGATVTLVNTALAVNQTAVTNTQGTFIFPQLPAGTYTITVELTGFKKAGKTNVILLVASKVNAGDFVLEVGNMNESVSVEADAGRLQIQTESGERSDVVTNRQLRDIALNGRNIADMMKLVPGVIAGGSRSRRRPSRTSWVQHQRHAFAPARIHRRRRHQPQSGQQHRRARVGEPRRPAGSKGADVELSGRVRQGRRRLHRADDARRNEPVPRGAQVLRPE